MQKVWIALSLAGFLLLCGAIAYATNVRFTEVATNLQKLSGGTVAWGDYDSDGDYDILITGYHSAYVASIYRNDDGVFTDIDAGLLGVNGAAAWGDYDNDGDLDVLITGASYEGHGGYAESHALVYRNDDGTFVLTDNDLKGVWISAAAWGDYDNDGDLDILLAGRHDGVIPISRIYRNIDGTFRDIRAGLPGVQGGAVAWGDYDGDGDLDLIIAGDTDEYPGRSRIAEIYRNDAGVFTDIAADLVAVARAAAAWGDYDNDGDLDLILAGSSEDFVGVTRVYRNDRGSFIDINAGLPGTDSGSVSWIDYDNDGDLDILLTGNRNRGITSGIYRNQKGTFSYSTVALPDIAYGSVAWSDYDNDGDLDILLAGRDNFGSVTKLFRNDHAKRNKLPSAPCGLSSSVSNQTAILSWSPARDRKTPQRGLTYNIRIGTQPGACDVLSGMADMTTGFRRVPQPGNAGENLSYKIHLPGPGTYYWSVQAVDGALAGGPFVAEQSFVVGPSAEVSSRVRRAATIAAVPNPFNPQTAIRYELKHPSFVTLEILDTAGRLVTTLVHEQQSAGMNQVVWRGVDSKGGKVASGVYFYRLQAGDFVASKRMVLLK